MLSLCLFCFDYRFFLFFLSIFLVPPGMTLPTCFFFLFSARAERDALKKTEEDRVAKEQQEQLEDAARLGNPLLALSTADVAAGRIKRKWNDDVVFRNQARGESAGMKKRFINDTVRNDFHRRFLDKFIL
jgi:protein CWC15